MVQSVNCLSLFRAPLKPGRSYQFIPVYSKNCKMLNVYGLHCGLSVFFMAMHVREPLEMTLFSSFVIWRWWWGQPARPLGVVCVRCPQDKGSLILMENLFLILDKPIKLNVPSTLLFNWESGPSSLLFLHAACSVGLHGVIFLGQLAFLIIYRFNKLQLHLLASLTVHGSLIKYHWWERRSTAWNASFCWSLP